MSNENKTRRGVLKAGLAAVGTVAAAGAAQAAGTGAQRFAQDKIAPAAVQYQPTPKDGQRCDKCVNWEPPRGCKIVSGDIAPEGWCIAYAPKEG